jgi:group II intron reverse transcriptase/maturase
MARKRPTEVLTALAHHMDMEWLREAFSRTRKDGAVGIDRVTAEEYAQKLDANLLELKELAKSGRYRAPAVRRAHIPKGNGETRPIGIPTFEDKVLQRAVHMILEPIYEQSFRDCSFGFRPGRSAHDALRVLRERMTEMGGGWIIDLDIRKFFDTLDHAHLRSIIGKRVNDGVLTRLIGKWLNAGVMEAGQLSYPERGTPQGGVISPLLANIYLHEVLDVWFENEVVPRLRGAACMVRYADDAVLVFETREDAERVLEVLPKRFEKYGLTVHPAKTKLVSFKIPKDGDGDKPKPGTFDFLGFTHYWARSRQGAWAIKRKTARARLERALKAIAIWCRRHMHDPVRDQWKILSSKLRGHYQYYGVRCNYRGLDTYRHYVKRIWFKWLNRRSGRRRSWDDFEGIFRAFPLPLPKIVHAI